MITKMYIEVVKKAIKNYKLTKNMDTKVIEEVTTYVNPKRIKTLSGVPSKDRPWEKYYPEEALEGEIPKETIYEHFKNKTKDVQNEKALGYQGEEFTFQEVFEKIDEVANAFLGMGVKPKDVVTICMPNTPETVYAFYALNKIGAIANMIEPRTNAERVKTFINQANSKYMIMIDPCFQNIEKIIDQTTLEKVIHVSPAESIRNKPKKKLYQLTHEKVRGNKYISWDEFLQKGKNIVHTTFYPFEEKYPVSMVYTGGTTGIPKAAVLTNESYNGQNFQVKYSGIDPKPGELFLGNIPFFSAYGSSSGMHNALCCGVKIELIPSYKPEHFPLLVAYYEAEHAMGVPHFFELLTSSKMSKILYKHLSYGYVKNFISGGDQYPEEHEREANEFLKNTKDPYGRRAPKIKKGLGMSEFAGGITTTINEESNKIGSVGVPLAQNNVKIVDTITKKELGYGDVGELYATGPTMMQGYYHNTEENEKIFDVDEEGTVWAKTGDLAYIDTDGCVFFCDRIKRAIMRPDGHTTPLVPIESAIMKSEKVAYCAVVGVKPSLKDTGKLPFAFVVVHEPYKNDPKIREELQKLCEENIPERERPIGFKFVDELPYTLLGKVDFIKLESIGQEYITKGNIEIDISSKPKVLIKKDEV